MFKKSVFLGFLLLSFFLFGSTVVTATTEKNRPKYAPDEVLVKFKKGQVNLSNPGLMSLFREYNTRTNNDLEKSEILESGNVVVYKIKDGRSVEEVINEVRLDSNVETVEPNYYSYVSDLGTDDVDKNKLWGLDNFGQTITFDDGTTSVGTSGADIDLPRAWNISIGTSDVIVAVIDTGVAWNHPDLVDNMWDGSNCVDQNGDTIVGGCLHGYNFVTNSTNPAPVWTDLDTSSHGTHVAGTIAAKVNNSLGIAGVGQKIKIMALNVQSADGHFYSSNIVKAIDFAIKNGAKVINASYGGPSYSSAEYDAINSFKDTGVFITTAGNDASDNETTHQYPSDYDLDNIISVAATDNKDQLGSFSNYGSTSVDVGAPGVDIYSTVSYRKDYIEDYLDYTNSSGSYWQVANTSNVGKIFVTDSRTPYSNNSDYTITSENINIAAMASNPTKLVFKAQCYDVGTTDSGGEATSDYVALEFSGNGTDFTEVSKFNKASISGISTGSCGSTYCSNTFTVDIGSSYLTSNFKYRLHWKTDSSSNTDIGCYVYGIKIIDYPENGTDAGYDFKDGTSMAAPYVAGLAGYLLSVNPSATYSQLRDNILNNGDAIDALSGKTTTGKRINAYNSVLEMGGVTPTPTETPTVTPTVTPVPAPSAPTSLVATPGDSQVLLSWTGPTDVGSSIIQYQVGYKLSSGGDADWTTQEVDTSEINVSNIAITGLTNGTSYDFRVAAVNQTGLGAYASSNGIVPMADFTNLDIAITTAQSWYSSAVAGTEYGQYPSTAIDDLQSAITVATGVKNNLTSNQDQIDLAVNALNSAITTFRATKIVPSNIGATNLSDLVNYGTFTTTPSNDNPGEISKITVTNNITVNIGENVAKDTVYLPEGTDITVYSDQTYKMDELSAKIVDVSTLSNLDSGFVKEAAIQWGIPDKTLVFSNPITISVYVGTDLNGRTLNVLRSPNGSSGWTNEGIVSPATCVVNSSGYCQFLTTKASYFVAASYEAPNQQNTNNNDNTPRPKICTDTPPIDNPDLFEIKTIKGSVKLFYTPTSQATSYAILYGLKKGDERFGTFINTINENKGVQNVDINMLNPKITYYFKVAAVNGCTMGPWSEWVPAKANRKNTIYKYKTIIKNKLKTLVNLFK